MSSSNSRAFIPGPLAGSGTDLWLLDVGKPVLLRREYDGTISRHAIPGAERGSGIVGYAPRWLHADDSGCWIVGADGIAHCDRRGIVTAVSSRRVDSSAVVDGVLATTSIGEDEVVLHTLRGGVVATVELPAEAQTINPSGQGFVVLMRTGRYDSNRSSYERGSWCARIGLDGALELGTAWEIEPWRGLDTVVDVGTEIALGRRTRFGQVLDSELKPAFAVPINSEFQPWPTASGVWMVMRTSRLVHALHDRSFASQPDLAEPHFTYFCVDRTVQRPERWAAAPGFPVGLAVVPDLAELWISTSVGTFAGGLGSGALTMKDAELDCLPDLPVTPPLELGDPDEWTERQRARLLAENKGEGLLDIEIDGWFPTTTLLLTFRVRGMEGVTCARSMSVFDRDGRPRLWQSAPTLMEWISLDILESGGLKRLRQRERGRFGYIWV